MANLLGPWGEEKAAEFLRRKGYALVASNYRCKFGEIDLIVKNRRYLVFVEVKLRKNSVHVLIPVSHKLAAPVRCDRNLCTPGNGDKKADYQSFGGCI